MNKRHVSRSFNALKYLPIILEICGMIRCLYTYCGDAYIELRALFSLSFFPALIIFILMGMFDMCWYNKLSIIYAFVVSASINFGWEYGWTCLPEILITLFFIGAILLALTLFHYFHNKRKRRLNNGRADSVFRL